MINALLDDNTSLTVKAVKGDRNGAIPDHPKPQPCPLVLVLLVGYFWKTGVHLHSTPEVYTISGIIYKAYGGARNCKMQCLSDLGLIKYVFPDLNSGAYSVSLSASEANALRRFKVVDADGDATTFVFDRHLFKDTSITIDLALKTIPRNYEIIVTSTEHPSNVTYDTIWKDLKGRRITKVLSDSLWRGIPHK